MKTFLIQYLMTWLKFLVLTPCTVISVLFRITSTVMLLFASALLGDGKNYKDIFDDFLDWMGL